jgi:hypothetical protein
VLDHHRETLQLAVDDRTRKTKGKLMSTRHLLLVGLLGVVLVFAALSTSDAAVWWLAPLEWLSHYQIFHIIAHSSVFAGVVALYGPQKRGLFWLVLGGGVAIELVQFAGNGFSMDMPELLDSLFDLAVDLAGAAACWLVLTPRPLQTRQRGQ